MVITNPTIGSDFELFIKDKTTNEFTSIEGKLGGTKEQPLDIGEGCYRQEDGVAAEFNIPPVTNKEGWLNSINYCLAMGQLFIEPNYFFVFDSSADFPSSQLETKQATSFGCSPSRNAWTIGETRKTPCKERPSLRTTGFHIHVGFSLDTLGDESLKQQVDRFIKLFDKYLGIPSLLLDPDDSRRQLYGEAGDHRVKIIDNTCIIEYRSLGGFMITYRDWVYDQIQIIIERFNAEEQVDEEIRRIIDHNMKDAAAQFIEQNTITLPKTTFAHVEF